MSTISPLFRRYVDCFTIGELPKVKEHQASVIIDTTPSRMRELGYVQVDGDWVDSALCAKLPKNGKFEWVRMC